MMVNREALKKEDMIIYYLEDAIRKSDKNQEIRINRGWKDWKMLTFQQNESHEN